MPTKPRKTRPAAETSPINMSLTVDQRDAIDAAQQRIRGCVTILDRLRLDADASETFQAYDTGGALELLVDTMHAALDRVDQIFEANDRASGELPARPAAAKGGAQP
jgi:hypothetical protein